MCQSLGQRAFRKGNVIIPWKASMLLTSRPAISTVCTVMNPLRSTFAVPPTSDDGVGATCGHYASAFFYPGYAYFYFSPLAGDT